MTQPVLNGTPTPATLAAAVSNSRSYSHTVPSLSNGGMIVLVPWESSSDRSADLSATWNGSAMTQVGTVAALVTAQGLYAGCAIFSIINPTATTANVVVTCATEATLFMGVLIANFDNCHQTTITGGVASTPYTGTQLTPSQAITSSTNDLAIAIAMIMNTTGVSAGSGDTQIGSTITESSSYTDARAIVVSNGGTNPTLDATFTGAGDGGVIIGFSLKGTGGGGGTSIYISFTG